MTDWVSYSSPSPIRISKKKKKKVGRKEGRGGEHGQTYFGVLHYPFSSFYPCPFFDFSTFLYDKLCVYVCRKFCCGKLYLILFSSKGFHLLN